MPELNIYLLSQERSGTNLLRERLSSAVQGLCSVPPVHLLRTLGYWEHAMGDFRDDATWCSAIGYALRCCHERAVPWDVACTVDEVADAYARLRGDERTLVMLADLLYRRYAQAKGCSAYFCKDLRLFDFAFEIGEQIDDAVFIHLYRDPRDFALSQRARPFGVQSAFRLARQWKEDVDASLRAVRSPGLRGRVVSLSYEALVSDEPATLARIIDTFGLPRARSDGGRASSATQQWEFHEWANIHRETISDNFGKYRESLSDLDVRIIEGIAWPTMRLLGYATESTERPELSWIHRVGEPLLQGAYQRLRSKLNRYRLRNEPINRRATQLLVAELSRRYR